MKLVAIALVLFFGAALSGEGFEALGNAQTDWYSRGIVRQQTIRVGTARQKRKQYLKRKKRKAVIRHRTTKSPSVAKSRTRLSEIFNPDTETSHATVATWDLQMRKQLLTFFLFGALFGFVPPSAEAQISTTGPAGLARQMPRIYGPYMANRSRIKNKQKAKHRRHQTRSRPRRLRR